MRPGITAILLSAILALSCKSKIKQQDDELYSRHLQKHMKLTIISTPMPGDKTELNLLLLNDGQDMGGLRVKEILDSLYRKDLIRPLIVVGIHAGDRMKEYGVADYPGYKNRGEKAAKYDEFVYDELYFFAKKKASVRKFNSVVIAGCAEGGLSAFDIAWNHADRINKVAVFSGSFQWADKSIENEDYNDKTDRIIFNKIMSSHKKPKLKYWFYGDDMNEKGLRYHDSITIDHTRDLIELLKNKNALPADINYTPAAKEGNDQAAWSKQLPAFLIWAFGK